MNIQYPIINDADRSFPGSLPLWGGLGWGFHAWRLSGPRGDLPAVYQAGGASPRMFAARDGPQLMKEEWNDPPVVSKMEIILGFQPEKTNIEYPISNDEYTIFNNH